MENVSLVKKFRYAGRGLKYLWLHESSWRWQVLVAVTVQLLLWYFAASALVWALLTLVSVAVLAAEAFNTALEKLLDIVEPRLSSQVGVLKNLLAAAVLIMAIGAVIVAFIVII